MKQVSFEKFKVNVPENSDEKYQVFGDCPAEAKRICDTMNIKGTIVKAGVFANMLSDTVKQKVLSIK